MRWLLALLALLGLLASVAALREHYREGASPCNINDRWDCGAVNHSPYAVIAGMPVAAIGIAGYLVMGILAVRRSWKLLVSAAVVGLAFSLYLAYVEARILELWCIYCVISLAAISAITVLSLPVAARDQK